LRDVAKIHTPSGQGASVQTLGVRPSSASCCEVPIRSVLVDSSLICGAGLRIACTSVQRILKKMKLRVGKESRDFVQNNVGLGDSPSIEEAIPVLGEKSFSAGDAQVLERQ
jgi:hypothetical protein